MPFQRRGIGGGLGRVEVGGQGLVGQVVTESLDGGEEGGVAADDDVDAVGVAELELLAAGLDAVDDLAGQGG